MALNITKELAAWERLPELLGPYGYSHVDGVPVARDEVAAQAIIDAITIDDVRAEISARIDTYASELRQTITAGVSPAEMASWSIKRAEAELYSATGNESSAPMLGMEARARGVTLNEIVLRVARNAAALAALEAVISGTSGKHRDALQLIDSIQGVLTYDWRTGWPQL